MPEPPIWQIPATDLVPLIRRRELSPVDIVESCLERVEAVDGLLNAFCSLDAEEARAAARRTEAALRRGDDVGPLAGIPVAVKDLIFTRGLRTTGGSTAYREFVPDVDDVVVERVRSAGGIIFGKTNVPAFGFGPGTDNAVFGPTRNPWSLDVTPGGSSGGSAVAVAAGMTPLALGSDGGGSIRIPSSFCGVVGFKPTFGVVPLHPGCRDARFPGFSGWETLEHIGPMARTVADVALLLDVIAGPDARDRHAVPRPVPSFTVGPSSTLQDAKIGYATTLGSYALIDGQVESVFSAALEALRHAGAVIEPVELRLDDPGPMYDVTVALESDIAGLRALASNTPGAVNPRIEQMLARAWSFEEASNAIAGRKELDRRVRRAFEQFDILLTPTVAVPPYRLDRPDPTINGVAIDDPRWLLWLTMPFNLTGHPAISIPCGLTASGLPVGIQVVADRFADLSVLGAASEIEAILPWAGSWPTVNGE